MDAQYRKSKIIKVEKYIDEIIKEDRLFVGCSDGSVQEFSIIENKTVHDIGKILDNRIVSMDKTLDNKSLLVCDFYGGFTELDISARKQVNSFLVKSAIKVVVTHDNKSLITAKYERKCNLKKQSVRSKKQLYTWKSDVNEFVRSQSCSQDSKYQLIGYDTGWLGIFDLQKHQTLKNIKVMSKSICSVAFLNDNQSVLISDYEGYIKMIEWQAGANSGDDFDFTEEPQEVGNYGTFSICLTKDEKYLLVGSCQLVSIFEIETRKVTKEFELTTYVITINLTKGGKTAIIAEQNGDLSIIDLETMEIKKISENIANKELKRIVII